MTKYRILICTSITAFALSGAALLGSAPASAQPVPTGTSTTPINGFIW